MASFTIDGPYELSYEKRKGGRTLVFDDFWSEDSPAYHLADECGCYVFAVRTGRGLNPIYVGKATKTFKQETINSSNKHKYHNGFSEYGKGKPEMFFVVHPHQKGKKNCKEIEEIEDFLIQTGIAKNPDLQNIKGASTPKWKIKGVIRGGSGNHGKAEAAFKKLFALTQK